ncbi:MAG TPA: sigma-54 dependent transcriptional regulator [Planctomycetaceae bacterium]|nr:sigma-54 dependent transcriptional regulator [Planctomycetaceae bacterium]
MSNVLVIDDDRAVQLLIRRAFEGSGIRISAASTGEEGLRAVHNRRPDLVLLDIVLPEACGLELFQRIQAHDPRLPVIFITAVEGSDTAIQAMSLGACDFLPKPLDVPRVRRLVEQTLETCRRMDAAVQIGLTPNGDSRGGNGHAAPAAPGSLRGDAGSNHAAEFGTHDQIVGRSPQMLAVYKAIGQVASENVPVLILGESGTGKELVARAIYQHSPRRHECYQAINVAALPDTLLESELFGHEKGAFTGADHRRMGKFEQCSGGTVFLDEIGDMSPLVQSKLLRFLQEQRFERVGGNETIQTDVRIIAATNRRLEHMIDSGAFREDLYYRLNGFTIELPPLRERGDDLLLLIEHFLNRHAPRGRRPNVEGVSPEAVQSLRRYSWPGNVRELESVLRKALMNATGPVIVPEFLPAGLRHAGAPAGRRSLDGLPDSDLGPFVEQRLAAGTTDLYAEAVRALERFLITRVMQATAGNQSRAAQVLGISRGTIRSRLSTLHISLDRDVKCLTPH